MKPLEAMIVAFVPWTLGCTQYSDLPPQCTDSSEVVSMDAAPLGFTGHEVVAWVGDSLAYTVTWRPEAGLGPLPDRLDIAFGDPVRAALVTPVSLVDGGCPALPGQRLSVVRPYTLTVGDAVLAEGISGSVATRSDRVEVHLDPESSVQISAERQGEIEAWLLAEHPGFTTLGTYDVGGLFDLAAPTFSLAVRWDGDDGGGLSSVWRAETLTPAP